MAHVHTGPGRVVVKSATAGAKGSPSQSRTAGKSANPGAKAPKY